MTSTNPSRIGLAGFGLAGFVYFIQAGGPDQPIKIGWASRPKRRLGALQVGNHEVLTLLATVPGTRGQEALLKYLFQGAKVRGEWFRATPERLELVQALLDGVRLEDWLAC